jgi:hypothetical protein
MTAQLAESTVLETLVREIPERDEWRGVRCWVRAEAAGGRCERLAVVKVYGFPFCAEHGAECKDGALEELLVDADMYLERLQGDPPLTNPAIARVIQAGW